MELDELNHSIKTIRNFVDASEAMMRANLEYQLIGSGHVRELEKLMESIQVCAFRQLSFKDITEK